MDINPVFVDRHGAQALDAHMRLRPATAHEHRLAISPTRRRFEEPSRLRDGRPILRPIRPGDEPAHYAFSVAAHPRGLHLSLLLHPEFPRREMARLTQIDYDREMAFIATATGPDSKPETLGRFARGGRPNNHTAGFASSSFRPRASACPDPHGQSWCAMRARLHPAPRRRVMGERLKPMLRVGRHLGFKLKASGEPGVVPGDLRLRPPSEGEARSTEARAATHAAAGCGTRGRRRDRDLRRSTAELRVRGARRWNSPAIATCVALRKQVRKRGDGPVSDIATCVAPTEAAAGAGARRGRSPDRASTDLRKHRIAGAAR